MTPRQRPLLVAASLAAVVASMVWGARVGGWGW